MMRSVTLIVALLACMGLLRGNSWARDSTNSPNTNNPARTHWAPLFYQGDAKASQGEGEAGIPSILPAEHGLFRAFQGVQDEKTIPDEKTVLVSHHNPAKVGGVYQGTEIEPVPSGHVSSGHLAPEFVPGTGAGSGCQSCGGGSSFPYNRCGCNTAVFPWIEGPGECDQWCVGPKWAVEADGLMLFREDTDWGPILAAVGSDPSLLTQFDQAPGARIFVTGYNDANFGLQVGYEGVYSWDATALFPQVDASRRFEYETSLNSVEINFLRKVSRPWKPFAGFRYVEIQENFSDYTTVDKPIPVPADPPAASVAYVDSGVEYLLKNRLIGFQLGARRDRWQLNKWFTLEAFANAGVYSNLFRRDNVSRTRTTIITGDDLSTPDVNEFSQQVTTVDTRVRGDFTNVAFLGEVGMTGLVRIHRCVALRAGYQAMLVDGIGQGLDAFFASGLNNSTAFYHGLQFGVEYRR